jgi:hypothetical protein
MENENLLFGVDEERIFSQKVKLEAQINGNIINKNRI